MYQSWIEKVHRSSFSQLKPTRKNLRVKVIQRHSWKTKTWDISSWVSSLTLWVHIIHLTSWKTVKLARHRNKVVGWKEKKQGRWPEVPPCCDIELNLTFNNTSQSWRAWNWVRFERADSQRPSGSIGGRTHHIIITTSLQLHLQLQRPAPLEKSLDFTSHN